MDDLSATTMALLTLRVTNEMVNSVVQIVCCSHKGNGFGVASFANSSHTG